MPAASSAATNAAAVMTKPGGTGSPARVISPRLAPLPPAIGVLAFERASNHRIACSCITASF